MHDSHDHEPAQGPAARPPLEPLELERLADTTAADSTDAHGGEGGTVAWKAAASSVPRLRQKPASLPDLGAGDQFPGFTQDALPSRSLGSGGERASQPSAWPATASDDTLAGGAPLDATPPFWAIWLEHVASLPRPILLGLAAVLVLGVVAALIFLPSQGGSVSLARLRQQPEAFDGRTVHVHGRAGEAFSIGGSYVFSLCQGRDTIVVYSRTRRPTPHEEVQARGTVSIGYLDGVPRVALLEDTESR